MIHALSTAKPTRARAYVARLCGLVAPVVLVLLLTPGRGWGATQGDTITIDGPGIDPPVSVRADADPKLYDSLQRQVSWMSGRTGDFANPPSSGGLGPGYLLTRYTGTAPTQVIFLYPNAQGGPRALRPQQQPTGTAPAAWFYATVTLPDVLRDAGVAVPEPAATGPAGISAEVPDADAASPEAPLRWSAQLATARLAFGANGLVALVSLLILIPLARFSHRWHAARLARLDGEESAPLSTLGE